MTISRKQDALWKIVIISLPRRVSMSVRHVKVRRSSTWHITSVMSRSVGVLVLCPELWKRDTARFGPFRTLRTGDCPGGDLTGVRMSPSFLLEIRHVVHDLCLADRELSKRAARLVNNRSRVSVLLSEAQLKRWKRRLG